MTWAATKPFPHYIYYKIEDDTIYFLGLVHEGRHPDYLKKRISQCDRSMTSAATKWRTNKASCGRCCIGRVRHIGPN